MNRLALQWIPLSLLLFASAALCTRTTGIPTVTQPPAAQDLPATLAAIQATQTDLAAPMVATPTSPIPPTELPSTQAALTQPPEVGSISGMLSYPSEFIPPQRIVATNLATGQIFYVDTALDARSYRIANLPPGAYYVVAYVADPPLASGYSQFVICGLSVDCTDHNLVEVIVKPGQETTGIDPGDWYAPQGTFPPDPTR